MAASWGCKIGDKTVRFDDLPPAIWMQIEKESGCAWSDAYNAPMKDLGAVLLVTRECVKVAEPDADPVVRAEELCATVPLIDEMIVMCDDDLPTGIRDGVPSKGDESSTAT